MSPVCVSFLATNEDKPTHDVLLLVDEAPFFGCVIDSDSLSLLHEVTVVLILVIEICLQIFETVY